MLNRQLCGCASNSEFVDALSNDLYTYSLESQRGLGKQNPTTILVKETVGETLPETRSLLTEFYRRYSEIMVSYFYDSSFS